MSTILEFHIGRGGRFYNPGFLRYEGVTEGISYTTAFENLFPPTDEYGNIDNDPEAEWLFSNGELSGLTNQQIQEGIGTINIDNDYNTTYTTYAKDCDKAEAYLVFLEAQKFDGKWCFNEPLEEIFEGFPNKLSRDIIQRAAEAGVLKELWDDAMWTSFSEEEFCDTYFLDNSHS